jgi:hypothetical protein
MCCEESNWQIAIGNWPSQGCGAQGCRVLRVAGEGACGPRESGLTGKSARATKAKC